MRTTSIRLTLALVAVPCVLATGIAADKNTRSEILEPVDVAQLWERQTNISTRDMIYGPWGREGAPDPQAVYTYLAPKTHGTNPGLVAGDPQGRTWHIKQGREAGPEVVVSRVLSAVGFHQPPVYMLSSFSVDKDSRVEVTTGGRFRLSPPWMKRVGEWSWYENPFVDTQPYRGLLVILAMLNSSDLKNVNNALYELSAPREGASRWFVVKDVGTSLGDIARFDPKPNDVALFERQKFITGRSHGFVAFDYDGVHGDLFRHRIMPEDVRWASGLLSQITERQWDDVFRAAGYAPDPASRFIRHIRQKIAEGLNLQ